MDAEVLALIVRARDEASAQISKVHKEMATLAHKADVAGRAMSGFHSILAGIGMGIGMAVFTDLSSVFERLTGLLQHPPKQV